MQVVKRHEIEATLPVAYKSLRIKINES